MAQVGGLEGDTVLIVLLASETLGDGELRHYRVAIDIVYLYFVHYLLGVAECFGYVAEDVRHLFWRFEPLLFGVVHSVDIVDEMVGAEADESVVRLCIFFVDKVGVVGADDFHAIFASQGNQYGVDLLLTHIHLLVASWHLCLVALQFDVIVLAKQVSVPLYGLLCFGENALLNGLVHRQSFYLLICQSLHDFLRQFATEACGAADDTLVPLL